MSQMEVSNTPGSSPDLLKESTDQTKILENGKKLPEKQNSDSSRPNSSLKAYTESSLSPLQATTTKRTSIPGSTNRKNIDTKQKLDLSSINKDVILAEIEVRMKRLKGKEDYKNSESYDDLEYLKATTRYGKHRNKERLALLDRVTELGVVDLFKTLFSKYFNTAKVHRLLRDILVVLWNGTDTCFNMCHAIINSDAHAQIIHHLNSDVLGPDETDVAKIYIIKGLLGIINNVSRLVEDSGLIFRELDAVSVLKKYLISRTTMIRCKCELILAYIMTEKEYEEMNADVSNIKFLIMLLEDAMSSPEHKSNRYGFSADEVLQGLNKIAVSDSNKLKLVEHGALKHYVTLMQADCSATENFEAARGIWTLAFKCAEDIKLVPGCLESLKVLSIHADDKIKKQALGALWILEGKDHMHPKSNGRKTIDEAGMSNKKKEPPESTTDDLIEEDDEKQHIFISYQWNNQETVLRIRDSLIKNGYKVWMDVDAMTGSILESMALAVEQAAVVIICMSQKYKESPNCRTEAEYTFRLQKEIIPLRLQPRYKADGWLGALVGNKLYFDFSTESRFPKSQFGLIKELDVCGKKQNSIIRSQSYEYNAVPIKQTVMTSTPSETSSNNWSSTEVVKWIESNKLDLPLQWFTDVDGSLLMEMKQLHCDAPEFFFATLKDELHLSLKQILRFTQVLKNLK